MNRRRGAGGALEVGVDVDGGRSGGRRGGGGAPRARPPEGGVHVHVATHVSEWSGVEKVEWPLRFGLGSPSEGRSTESGSRNPTVARRCCDKGFSCVRLSRPFVASLFKIQTRGAELMDPRSPNNECAPAFR